MSVQYRVIPLNAGASYAHQQFSVQLGGNFTTFRISYLQSQQWSADILIDNVLVAAGVMLEPNCSLLNSYDLTESFGKLVMTGSNPKIDNLGIDNKLIWVSPDA